MAIGLLRVDESSSKHQISLSNETGLKNWHSNMTVQSDSNEI